jgi:UDP-galactopyranose mutase
VPWEHKVVSSIDGQFVPMPVNIITVNSLCGENIQTEAEMLSWLSNNQIPCTNPNNSEDTALSRIGPVLYTKLVKDYTFKQWNKYPAELDKSVLERIPVRSNFDCRYFTDKYQALPAMGYTHFFEQILKNPNIRVLLETDYFTFPEKNFDFTIFTGPIDSYFPGEKLEYRSINFHREVFKDTSFYQPNSVVNYPSAEVHFTRIVEYKHFLNQKSKDTIIFKETTCSDGEPYYPVLNKKNLELYENYRLLAEKEESRNVFFIGRLANYKYFNMDEAILNSLRFVKSLGSRL